MTAKEEGLWDPLPPMPGLVPVSREDIRHMQNRVHQFNALAPLPVQSLVSVPQCAESFCRWLVVEAADAAAGEAPRPLPRLAGRALPALPTDVAAPVPAAPTAPAPTAEAPAAPQRRAPNASTSSRPPPSPDPGDEERELMEDRAALDAMEAAPEGPWGG